MKLGSSGLKFIPISNFWCIVVYLVVFMCVDIFFSMLMHLIFVAWIVDGDFAIWNAESRDLARYYRPISVRISVDYVTRDQINSGDDVDQERFKHGHRNKPTEQANSIGRPCPLLITFKVKMFFTFVCLSSIPDLKMPCKMQYVLYIHRCKYISKCVLKAEPREND